MEHTPFSVAMCVYEKDNPEHFRTAVESILNQTVIPYEIVLVVDGPVNEELDKLIDNYKRNSIFNVIRLLKNTGHGNARKISLYHCKYELVALMDADDISMPNRFELQLECFKKKPWLSVVGGNIVEFINNIENTVGMRNVPQQDKDIKEYLKKRCPMNQVTTMFKKSDLKKAGGYIDWFCEEDYYLWIRLYQIHAVFENIDAVLVQVRVGKDMYQRRGGIKYFKSEALLQMYMLKHKVISTPIYVENILKRFLVQVLMPNQLRGWIFQKFAREGKNGIKRI